jgi:hypothetical protein
MTQALIEELVTMAFEDKDFVRTKKMRDLFQLTIDEIRNQTPYWLKHYRGDWSLIRPAKTAILIKQQLAIDQWKKEVDKIADARSRFYKESKAAVEEYSLKQREQERLCKGTPDCAIELERHLKICPNECRTDYIAYECRCSDHGNGRCSHYWLIKFYEDQLEYFEYMDNEYTWEYEEALYELNKAKRVQQLGSEEAYWEERRNDDDDDW